MRCVRRALCYVWYACGGVCILCYTCGILCGMRMARRDVCERIVLCYVCGILHALLLGLCVCMMCVVCVMCMCGDVCDWCMGDVIAVCSV